MRQTLAIFLDAYRELNSKKLFWIVMAISLAVVVALAIPTNNERGIQMFGVTVELPLVSSKEISPKGFYAFILSWVGVNWWLTWGAILLALVSTAGMIPDMVSSGSIELSLSRPIGRLRLFLTKYAAGLLFVAAQSAVFGIGAWLVMGIRGGSWSPTPLMAIPIATLVFSYVFCICVLIGMATRSTLLALLGTVIIWLGIWAFTTTEGILQSERVRSESEVVRIDSQLGQLRDTLKAVDDKIAETTAASEARQPAVETLPGDIAQSAPTPDAATPDSSGPADARDPSRGPPRRPGGTNRLLSAGRAVLFAAQASQSLDGLRRSRESLSGQITSLETRRPERAKSAESVRRWHRILKAVVTLMPKTGETKNLFQRTVVDKEDQEGLFRLLANFTGDQDVKETSDAINRRSLGWVLGTSLLFEALVLALAAWIFCRRDF